MTVAAQNVAPQISAAAGQTIFPFAWRCDDSALVTVWVNDVLDGGFTVIRNADQTASPGGNVVRAAPCTGGEVVTVERLSPQTQTTALTKYGPFPADTITSMVDKFVMLTQEAASTLGKCVKAARSTLAKWTSLELPIPQDGKMLTCVANPLNPALFTLGLTAAATKEYLENYVQQVLGSAAAVQPLSWTMLGDDINTDYDIVGALLNAPELYLVDVGGVPQEPVAAYSIDVVAHKIKFTAVVPLNARIYVRTLGYAKAIYVTDQMSADRGDVSPTLTPGTDYNVQRFATALTANRTITLAAGRVNGDHFRVTRTGLGAFTLNVGGLKTIPISTAAFVDVMWDGAAWRLIGYSTL